MPKDISAMVYAIEELIGNPRLRKRLAENGRKIAETYSWDNAVDEREKILLDIYNDQVNYDIYSGFAETIPEIRDTVPI